MADLISLGNLVVDRDRYDAWIGGRRLGLTYAEYELLLYMARKADKVVQRGELAHALWGQAAEERGEVLRVHISRLRKKLDGSDPYTIKTVLRRGYALTASEHQHDISSRPAGPVREAAATRG